MERTATIKPGFLISLATTLRGGVSYSRVELETERTEEEARERWETTKVVQDPAEYERAKKAQSTCSSIIRRVCVPFGRGGALLCPLAREADLDAAIARARVIADEHNRNPANEHTRLSVFVLKARFASTDEEATRAIGSEVRDLIDAMGRGIEKLDANAIRDAADRARKLGQILDETQEAKLTEAIKQARRAAREIVKRVEKEGEKAEIVLKDIQRGAIEKARLAFLDLEPVEASAGALPAVDLSRAAQLDLEIEHAPESGETLKAAEG